MERGGISGPVYPVYKGKGFPKWRRDIELELMDLLNIKLGVESLGRQETKEEKRLYSKRERKAYAKLLWSLDDSSKSIVKSSTTVAEAWDMLIKHEKRRDSLGRVELKCKFFSNKFAGKEGGWYAAACCPGAGVGGADSVTHWEG